MRLVLDTNIVIAALLWSGPPNRLIELAAEGTVELVSSAALLAELTEVLHRTKFVRKLTEQHTSIPELVQRYRELAELLTVSDVPSWVAADPDDDHVLACALAARVDLIVSGDHHLLELKLYQGIPIISAAEALQRIKPLPSPPPR
jgi:putative PIN family toxin of toxin-antitoxin system